MKLQPHFSGIRMQKLIRSRSFLQGSNLNFGSGVQGNHQVIGVLFPKEKPYGDGSVGHICIHLSIFRAVQLVFFCFTIEAMLSSSTLGESTFQKIHPNLVETHNNFRKKIYMKHCGFVQFFWIPTLPNLRTTAQQTDNKKTRNKHGKSPQVFHWKNNEVKRFGNHQWHIAVPWMVVVKLDVGI